MNTQNIPIAFSFENTAVRIIPNKDTPLFVAKDVATALGYTRANDAIQQHCKGAVKYRPLATAGGNQEIRVIDGPDVYRLIFGSKLESAKRFQNWVFEEVLPTIRKTGGYSASSAKNLSAHYLHLKLLDNLQKNLNEAVRTQIYEQYCLVSEQIGITPASLEALISPKNQHDASLKDKEIQLILMQATAFFKEKKTLFLDPDFPSTASDNCPGYVKRFATEHDKEPEYYVYPKVFRDELYKGFEKKKVMAVLHCCGWLCKDASNRWQYQLQGIDSSGQKRKRLGRFYKFTGIEPERLD